MILSRGGPKNLTRQAPTHSPQPSPRGKGPGEDARPGLKARERRETASVQRPCRGDPVAKQQPHRTARTCSVRVGQALVIAPTVRLTAAGTSDRPPQAERGNEG